MHAAQKYYGARINKLSELHHAVSGEVFAVDSRTLFIKGFNYDGEGPAAYFYVGNTKAPNAQGAFRIRDERGSNGVLRKYRNKDITLTLPEGKTLRDIKWFSVWCDEFSVDFGNVLINKNLDFPRPKKVGNLKGIHAVSSDNVVIVDAQTLLIPNFSYDGVAPGTVRHYIVIINLSFEPLMFLLFCSLKMLNFGLVRARNRLQMAYALPMRMAKKLHCADMTERQLS